MRVTFREVAWPLAIVSCQGRILVRRRQANGLLAKLWELPGVETEPRVTPEAVIRQELRPLSVAGLLPQPLGELRHSITNRRIHAPVLLYRWPINKTAPECKPEWRWIVPTELHRYATSALTSKAVKLFIEYEKTAA